MCTGIVMCVHKLKLNDHFLAFLMCGSWINCHGLEEMALHIFGNPGPEER